MMDQSKIYQMKRIAHWDTVAKSPKGSFPGSQVYLTSLLEIYQNLVSPGKRVLELGCGQGDLLAQLQPGFGLGIDFSLEMVKIAKKAHPGCHFICADIHHLRLKGLFDVIIFSDILNDLWDIQRVLGNVQDACHEDTVILVNFVSRVWELPLKLMRWLGLSRPNLAQNWLTPRDVRELFDLAGFSFDLHWREILLPVNIPILSDFFNEKIGKLQRINALNLVNFIRFRPSVKKHPEPALGKKVSVVVPVRDEAGNIHELFKRIPNMGSETEIILVEGHSRDASEAAIKEEIKANPNSDFYLLKQPGEGKADAVFHGLDHASGDILMILDADLSFEPELLLRFYDALIQNKGDVINGVRLVYPMRERAMPYLNLLGNKLFGWVFSIILGQPIRDTLCGTKAFRKSDYEIMRKILEKDGLIDPFGDFSLLLCASKMNLRICQIPIRYHHRTYGQSKTRPWRDGLKLGHLLVKFLTHRTKYD